MIKHIKRDIFESNADIILHQVNCRGVMGSGVAKQVRDRYPRLYEDYKRRCKAKGDKLLGKIRVYDRWFLNGEHRFVVVNLHAQKDFGYDGKCYTDYNALRDCLQNVHDNCSGTVIAIPYLMGCHRGGGDWNIVYAMIEEIFTDRDVLICEYNGG